MPKPREVLSLSWLFHCFSAPPCYTAPSGRSSWVVVCVMLSVDPVVVGRPTPTTPRSSLFRWVVWSDVMLRGFTCHWIKYFISPCLGREPWAGKTSLCLKRISIPGLSMVEGCSHLPHTDLNKSRVLSSSSAGGTRSLMWRFIRAEGAGAIVVGDRGLSTCCVVCCELISCSRSVHYVPTF